MKKNTTKDLVKVAISITWSCASAILILIGSELDTAKDGDSFSLKFFIGLISAVICGCYIKKWISEDEDRRNITPYDENRD